MAVDREGDLHTAILLIMLEHFTFPWATGKENAQAQHDLKALQSTDERDLVL